MNELDSQRMVGQLMQQGVLPTKDPKEADLILLNSCSVREKAVHKVYSRLGEYRLLRKERAELLIGLCGCVASRRGRRPWSGFPISTSCSDRAGWGSWRRSSPGAGRGSGWWRPAFPRSGRTTSTPWPARESTKGW